MWWLKEVCQIFSSPILQARAIRERIGYSDNIMDDKYLNNEYKDVSVFLEINVAECWVGWLQPHISAAEICLWILGFYEPLRIYDLVLIALVEPNPPACFSGCVLVLAELQCRGVLWKHPTEPGVSAEETPAETQSQSQQRGVRFPVGAELNQANRLI